MSEPPRELSENAKWALQDSRTCDFATLLLANRGKAIDDAPLAKLLEELEECRQRFQAALSVDAFYAGARRQALDRLHDRRP